MGITNNPTKLRQNLVCQIVLLVLIFYLLMPNTSYADEILCNQRGPLDHKIERIFKYWSNWKNGPVGEGPRLDELNYLWMSDAWFRIPLGYINPWYMFDRDKVPTRKEYIDKLVERADSTGYDATTGRFNSSLLDDGSMLPSSRFAFWMPSLRHVEYNTRYPASPPYRPCEYGRIPPDENEYVVKFFVTWPGVDGVEKTGLADGFYNLLEYAPKSHPDHIILSENNIILSLTCTQGRSCNGEVWDRNKKIIINIRIPEYLRKTDPKGFWKEPVNAATALFLSWREKGED
ncbi:hypothetical protein [Curvivirga aplysinae]|uniref:hypothetical protein n=1 Tax=Curvivirga aplysinae TaxID=2529852 RepID=UPI0012BC78F9|nr:hypothetical protein [Curvivirga aplysinae]MTI08551.1 hypothetical protein [Curvivirga aplysinae]